LGFHTEQHFSEVSGVCAKCQGEINETV
jgi:hypothetical protein